MEDSEGPSRPKRQKISYQLKQPSETPRPFGLKHIMVERENRADDPILKSWMVMIGDVKYYKLFDDLYALFDEPYRNYGGADRHQTFFFFIALIDGNLELIQINNQSDLDVMLNVEVPRMRVIFGLPEALHREWLDATYTNLMLQATVSDPNLLRSSPSRSSTTVRDDEFLPLQEAQRLIARDVFGIYNDREANELADSIEAAKVLLSNHPHLDADEVVSQVTVGKDDGQADNNYSRGIVDIAANPAYVVAAREILKTAGDINSNVITGEDGHLFDAARNLLKLPPGIAGVKPGTSDEEA